MKSIKDRVGSVVESTSAAAAIKQIVAAEEAGIRQIWMNQAYLDTLTVFAAAATKTSEVRLDTAIVQAGVYKNPIVTEITPFKDFYVAKDCHKITMRVIERLLIVISSLIRSCTN